MTPLKTKIGNYRNAIIPGNEINDDLRYSDFMKEDESNIDDLIEFQERLEDESMFAISK